MGNQTEPSRPTVKQLFALSGNKCAFPKCTKPLIDPKSGTVIGRICHIKGEKPTAARYDPSQSPEQRHAFENLILLCGDHHAIIDDDEVSYTVQRLTEMKTKHESTHRDPVVEDSVAEKFVSVAITNTTVHGSIVTTHGQTGGQAAHTIINYGPLPSDDRIQLEAKIDQLTDLESFSKVGCVGLRFTVICRSNRPGKIQRAFLSIGGLNVMKEMQQNFPNDFEHTPVEGETETVVIDLFPLSKPVTTEGYVLNRDDVCRFLYPLPTPWTLKALQAKPDDVTMGVVYFDGTEIVLLTGAEIQTPLRNIFEVYHEMAGKSPPYRCTVKASSHTKPTAKGARGRGAVNTGFVQVNKPEDLQNQIGTDETARSESI